MSTTTTVVKERPILFSGPMVRAILEGRKTQTRRVIATDWWRCLDPEDDDDRASAIPQCPYGQPGERLWVRESWASQIAPGENNYCIAYKADGECSGRLQDGAGGWMAIHHGWISGVSTVESGRFYGRTRYGSWCPSIHMPRWASRLTLEITRVRVERLQDISEEDALSEGVTTCDGVWSGSTRNAYRELWNSINAKRGLPWATNPWVWVIDFRRTTP